MPQYVRWLCGLVGIKDSPGLNYFNVCETLNGVYYRGWLKNDKNREMDGKELRERYIRETGDNSLSMSTRCTFLEMMVALAIRMNDEAEDYDISYWFFEMLKNLRLWNMDDEHFKETDRKEIVEKCVVVRGREYEYDGSGGLFPLKDPPCDMRDVELFFQMTQYIHERYFDINKFKF